MHSPITTYLARLRRDIDRPSATLWPILYALNLPLAVVSGIGVCDWHGLLGMLTGIFTVLLLGWWLCAVVPGLMRIVHVGAVPLAISQVVPIAQFLAGLLAYCFLEPIGLANNVTQPPIFSGLILGELGAFLAVLIVFVQLLIVSCLAGIPCGVLLPRSWTNPPERPLNRAS